MYENPYVKNHKKRKLASFVGGVSALGITALSIVAFLGRFVGTYTVTLNSGHVKLAISQDKDFEKPTSFLMVESLPKYEEYTYSHIKADEANIDSDATDYLYGNNKVDGEIFSLNFFKYTFYVKNIGPITASYQFKIRILESNPSTDGRRVEETLRVALYENYLGSDEHKSTVYAQASKEGKTDEEGKQTFNEYISVSPDKQDPKVNPYYGFAEKFISDDTICTHEVRSFIKESVMRYTMVCWLEGQDPQSNESLGAPVGASIKLGVEINAYED